MSDLDPKEVTVTRDEILDVALLDVLADSDAIPVDVVLSEAQESCADHEAWSPDVWPLLEAVPPITELRARLRFLEGLGMVRSAGAEVRITRAGLQMWDGFPWEYFAEDDEDR